nr:MAG: hypothetical protein DIU75_22725 [Mycolicibacterium hassiacum]
MTRRALAVLDIDGTVADGDWRLPLLGDNPATASRAAWAAFFDAAGDDKPIRAGVRLAQQLSAEHEICWLTGRSDRIRELTIAWLRRHGLPIGLLRMRPNDDLRPSRVWKIEQLQHLAREHTIAVVVDDDPRVVKMATEQGFPARLAPGVTKRDTPCLL